MKDICELRLKLDEDEHYELSEGQARRLIEAVVNNSRGLSTTDDFKALGKDVRSALARAWDAGWSMGARHGKAHYNPFGEIS